MEKEKKVMGLRLVADLLEAAEEAAEVRGKAVRARRVAVREGCGCAQVLCHLPRE